MNGFSFPSDGVLVIMGLTSVHAGTYTCVATNSIAGNEVGSVESSTSLQIIGKFAHRFAHVCACVCVCVRACMCVCVRACMRARICMLFM